MDKLYKIQTTITFVATDIIVRAESQEAALAYATSNDEWKGDGVLTGAISEAPKDDNGKPIFTIAPIAAIEITTPHDVPYDQTGDVLPWGVDGAEELCLAEIFYGVQDPYDAGVLVTEEDEAGYDEAAMGKAWDKYRDDKDTAIEKFNSEMPAVGR